MPAFAIGQFGYGVKSYCSDCCSCFEDATFKLYNVGGATAIRIASTSDNNRVWRNTELDEVGPIDRDEVIETTSTVGDILYSCDPIFSSGERGSSHRSLMPEYLASDELGTTASRSGGIEIKIFSLTATTADIFRNGVLITTIPLTVNTVDTYVQTGAYTGNWKIEANGLILGFKSEDAPFNVDASVMMKPSVDLIGWASTSAYIAKESGSATPLPFEVYSHLGNYTTGTIASTYNIVNSADLPHNTAQDNYYDPRVNIRVQSTEGLYGNGRGDSDGGDDTSLTPTDLLRTHHKIPQPSEYVSISNLNGSPIQVLDASGALITTLTPTKTNTDALAPYAVRYGAANGGVNVPVLTEFVSTEGIEVIYQPKGAGVFGSDDDETRSHGYNL